MTVPTRPAQTLAFAAALLLALAVPSWAQTFTTIATLNPTTGESPLSAFVQGFDGNLYGTTFSYGAFSAGAFFQLTSSGAVTPLYSFCHNYTTGCPDGAYPQGALALGIDGDFYGVTTGSIYSAGQGTVYKISSTGSMTLLHSFCLNSCTDGAFPTLGLTLSQNGEFYGVSNAGEKNPDAFYAQVFKISSSGIFNDVLTVCPGLICPTDAGPIGVLLQSSGGALVAPGPGPTGNAEPAALFSMSAAGVPVVLDSFCADSSCHDGYGYIRTPLAQASSNGEIYGTFGVGGTGAYCTESSGCGTAFDISTAGSGSFTKLHDFCSEANCDDGANPNALIVASDGNFYGTTSEGGANGYGTLFSITSTGTFGVLHAFSAADGFAPAPIPLLQSTDGNLYGSTYAGIYRLSNGLPPFVKAVQNSGAAGTTVTILGTNLTGATSVAFHGVTASFSVVSPTQITATVPARATSGLIKVVTPTNTLQTNVAFQVSP